MAIVKVMAFLLYEVATCLKLIPMTVTTVWTREIECVFSLFEVSESISLSAACISAASSASAADPCAFNWNDKAITGMH